MQNRCHGSQQTAKLTTTAIIIRMDFFLFATETLPSLELLELVATSSLTAGTVAWLENSFSQQSYTYNAIKIAYTGCDKKWTPP